MYVLTFVVLSNIIMYILKLRDKCHVTWAVANLLTSIKLFYFVD